MGRLLTVGEVRAQGGAKGVEEDKIEEPEEEEEVRLGRTEAITFPQSCPNCHQLGEVVNCVTDIPFFKVSAVCSSSLE